MGTATVVALTLAALVSPTVADEAPLRPYRTASHAISAQSDATRQTLLNDGVVLLPSEGPAAEGLVLFHASRDSAYQLLSAGGRQVEYRPELVRIRSVQKGLGYSVEMHQIKMLFMEISYQLRYRFFPDRAHIRWTMDPDYENGLEHIDGYWWLFEMEDDRTLGLFGTSVRVGAALPNWLQDSVTRKNIPQTLERCREWVNSGGRRRR